MLSVRLRIEDLLDGQPVSGAAVSVAIDVVGRWSEHITADNLRAEFDQAGITIPKGGMDVLLPDFERAERLTQETVSDEEGNVAVTFAADAAFARVAELRRDGVAPVDVGALLVAGVTVATVAQEVRFLGGVLGEGAADFIGRNETVQRSVPVDFGKSIVGHVTASEARIFFRVHGDVLPGQVFVCEVARPLFSETETRSIRLVSGAVTAAKGLAASVQIDPNSGEANTAVAHVSGLEAGARYHYTLFLRTNAEATVPGAGRPLLRGAFTTDDPDADQLVFVFASCHNPTNLGDAARRRSLNRWQALAARNDYEMLLLIGDQIYGDGIELPISTLPWADRYRQRYDRFWVYPELRQVLRRTPTYMILDDHDVIDDFAVKPIPAELGGLQREGGALQAYETFQQSHGPSGRDGPRFYHFRRGPAAFFVVDNRTERATDPQASSAPILGGAQRRALRAWAEDVAASDVDVVFLVVPVPIAFLPVEEIQRLKKELKGKGALAGALLLSPLGPAVALAGAAYGYYKANTLLDEKGLNDLTDRDLADMWTLGPNQKDLVFLMDLLYGLANDVQADGRPGNRPRAVFLLGGDVHMGVLHMIRSFRNEHHRNPFIVQAIASPISQQPADDVLLQRVVANIHSGDNVELLKLLASKLDPEELVRQTFGEAEDAAFVLDDQEERNYVAEFITFLAERNFGSVSVERVAGRQRCYRFHFKLEGTSHTRRCSFLLDLNAPQIQPIRDDATFVRQAVPKTMEPAKATRVTITMRNSGVSIWTPAYRLESLSPAWAIEKVPVPQQEVAPGEEVTFTFQIAALSRGDFPFRWRMARQFKGQFGAATPKVTIRVGRKKGKAACKEIAQDLKRAEQQLRNVQKELGQAAPPLKPHFANEVQRIRGEIRALQARAARLGCP